MPAGDGTGPMGMGPWTGRGVGYCGGYDAPGWTSPGPGRRFYGRGGRGFYGRGGYGGGQGFGRGGGRGWRHQFYATGLPRRARGPAYAPPSREQEVEMLKGEAAWLKEQLDAIGQRMDELGQE